jgi:hypothetical protein
MNKKLNNGRYLIDGTIINAINMEDAERLYLELSSGVNEDVQQTEQENEQYLLNKESREYLNTTDWYIVRQTETGVETPKVILDARAQARTTIV